VSASGSDANSGTKDAPYKTLAKAVWKAKDALDEARRTVVVKGDLSEVSGNFDGESIFCITDTGAAGITIRGDGTGAKLMKTTSNSTRARILYLGPGTRVTLENIEVTKGYFLHGSGIHVNQGNLTLGADARVSNNRTYDSSSRSSAVLAEGGATLTLLEGSEVSGNTADVANYGTGIVVIGTTLIINGGSIKDHISGKGIVAKDYSTVTMEKGLVSGNTAPSDGGGLSINYNSTFTMKGGTITGNTSTGGTYERYGGGVVVSDHCTFTMSGGSITGNYSSGLGGGLVVAHYSTGTMTGGSITGNSARVGGGLVVSHYAKGSMTGGSITENTASRSGGGLAIENSSFIMKGEAAITDNTSEGRGGGVEMGGASSFTMEGGSIAKNTAKGMDVDTTWQNGGGIHISAGAFSMTGGSVYGTNGNANANQVSNGYGAALWDNTASSDKRAVNTTLTSYPPPPQP
jgi:hypothetical protein